MHQCHLASIWRETQVFDVLGSTHYPNCSTGKGWAHIKGNNLVHISVGSEVWGVNRQQNIYKYLGGNNWKQMPGQLDNVSLLIEEES